MSEQGDKGPVAARRILSVVLLAAALALLYMALPLPGRARAGTGGDIRRVVVIHFDTTRVDDLSCYGGVARTPHVDAVAARGLRYLNSIAPLPKTSPSVASFLTARLANRHGVYDVGSTLPDDLPTLPEVLRDHGFATGGFVSNLVVDRLRESPDRAVGFDRGFDVFKGIRRRPEVPPGAEANEVPRVLCEPLIEEALAFVDEHADDRFFLWMLHLDPHAPYAPPPPYDTMYLDHPDLVARSVEIDPEAIHHQAYVPGRVASHEYIARHLGEVTMLDDRLGTLLRRLETLPGRTLLVITADHGESLGDKGYWFGHGSNVRYPCVNVPLIIACDGIVPTGTSEALVANVDLAPTILDLLGIDGGLPGANGLSLVPTFSGTDPWPDRMIPIQAYEGLRWRGVRSRDFSFQSAFDPETGGHVRSFLHDVRRDPTESRDIAGDLPEVAARHAAFERSWFGQGYRIPQDDAREDPEMIRRLRSLGYVK